MAANLAFRFDDIAANGSISVFLHGYGNKEAVSYSGVVFAGTGAGVPFPAGRAQITSDGEIYRHVDQTAARKVYVRNLAPFNSCLVDILQITERF